MEQCRRTDGGSQWAGHVYRFRRFGWRVLSTNLGLRGLLQQCVWRWLRALCSTINTAGNVAVAEETRSCLSDSH